MNSRQSSPLPSSSVSPWASVLCCCGVIACIVSSWVHFRNVGHQHVIAVNKIVIKLISAFCYLKHLMMEIYIAAHMLMQGNVWAT